MYAASTALDELLFRKKLTIIHITTDKLERKANKNGQGNKEFKVR